MMIQVILLGIAIIATLCAGYLWISRPRGPYPAASTYRYVGLARRVKVGDRIRYYTRFGEDITDEFVRGKIFAHHVVDETDTPLCYQNPRIFGD